ncbi:MAG: sigma 54-interacting transcriptional regulator [Thermodesulfobacteriota bacterium]
MNQRQRYKFALVGHSWELAEAVRSCIDQEKEEVIIKVVNMGEAIPTAQAMFDQGVEVVFGHMGNYHLMYQATGKPVVRIIHSDLDLIKAFKKARETDRRIGFTQYGRKLSGMELIEELLDIEVHQIVFQTHDELERGVYSAFFDQGLRVSVGGGISRKVITDLGGVGIVVIPSRSVIEMAFQEARTIAEARRKELGEKERLNTVLQMVEEGVIGVDRFGRMDIYNEAAEQMLGVNLKADLGHSLSRIIREVNLLEVLTKGRSERDMIKKIGPAEVVVNTLPITIQGQVNGAVALLKEASRIRNINRKLKESLYSRGFTAKHQVSDLRGKSISIKRLINKIIRFAQTEATVLIQGETGTGKEIIAQSIHNGGSRRTQPFVAVNCAALPEALLESELFGYEEGAFTGAKRGGKIGLFELANKGSLFLDEIADIPPSLQVRLLRVLETKEVMRVGGDRYVPVDVRIMASTYKNLQPEVEQGRFRADLYYRLAVLRLQAPPLRERLEDIPFLIEDLLGGRDSLARSLTPEMIKALKEYHWPGNVRELRSFMESYLVLLDGEQEPAELFHDLLSEFKQIAAASTAAGPIMVSRPPKADLDDEYVLPSRPGASLKNIVESFERRVIDQTMENCRFNRMETARRLGISVNTLWRKMKNH